jgi:hypothetical protein
MFRSFLAPFPCGNDELLAKIVSKAPISSKSVSSDVGDYVEGPMLIDGNSRKRAIK